MVNTSSWGSWQSDFNKQCCGNYNEVKCMCELYIFKKIHKKDSWGNAISHGHMRISCDWLPRVLAWTNHEQSSFVGQPTLMISQKNMFQSHDAYFDIFTIFNDTLWIDLLCHFYMFYLPSPQIAAKINQPNLGAAEIAQETAALKRPFEGDSCMWFVWIFFVQAVSMTTALTPIVHRNKLECVS